MASVIRGDDNFDTAYAKSVAIIADVKDHLTYGGGFTSGAWRTRDLNTELDDPSNIVTIASNQFTLQAGTYLVEWSTPAYKVDRHSSRLQNITDSTTEELGTTEFTNDADGAITRSIGASVLTLTGAKAFEIQHYAQRTFASYGFGLNSSISNINSVFTLVKIHKIGA